MKKILFAIFIFYSILLQSQKTEINSNKLINKISNDLINGNVQDYFFYSTNCLEDAISTDNYGNYKHLDINIFKIYCFWIKDDEIYLQKFDNWTNNNFNEINISKPLKIKKNKVFEVIFKKIEIIKTETILDVEYKINKEIAVLDSPDSCLSNFKIHHMKNDLNIDFLSFKLDDKKSINYNRNQKLNITKLYKECEKVINILNNSKSFETLKREKIN